MFFLQIALLIFFSIDEIKYFLLIDLNSLFILKLFKTNTSFIIILLELSFFLLLVIILGMNFFVIFELLYK